MSEISNFSSDEIAISERPRVVSDVISSVLTNIDVSEPEGRPLEANVKSVVLKNTVLASFNMGPVIFERTAEMTKDQDDRFSLIACVGGSYDVITPDGSMVPVVPGMAGLVSHRLPSRTMASGKNQEKTLVFPRNLINNALRDPDERIGALPEGGMVAIRLMTSYMNGLLSESDPIRLKMQQMIEGHVLDLLANAYDPSGEWSRAAPNDGVNAARLQQILRHISENFADQGLNAASLATEYGVSSRRVHQLLETTGATLSEHLLEQRLQAARQALQNTRSLDKRISEIAMDSGFSDISYFNRCIKRRFGDSPSGLRPVKG